MVKWKGGCGMVALALQGNLIDFPTALPQSKNSEWYTPHYIIEAARQVMGDIDLDPASCEQANRVVQAKHFYTRKDNGLEKDWYGNVWLNPPYGKLSNKSMLDAWIRNLVQGYEDGQIEQAVLLATTNIEAPWFRLLWNYPICFVDHEVRFLHPQGIRKCHLFGTTLTYLGSNEQRFIDTFSQFGRIARAIDTPKQPVVATSLWNVQGGVIS